ncbi:MAG: exosome complex exonuclease Rrp41 [Nanoarchaeota archaeon]|nr:exosome complex exonuclease Rrp41 [Nanoarchaeota archaeon]MBU1029765.1 exosome complex exonuclease Rrp41 [Nanoarchaeota archaeon]MBU1850772.1 exosome complex exonuclease Rrp41 [Nanoarchaeota archaeon]
MSYKKRLDGRGFDETRPIEAKAGVIHKANGSGYFKIGNTVAYAAVYGPREMFPRSQQNPKKGVLRCNYNMMPFSGAGDRVRPGPSRRSKEISYVTEKALLPVVDLSDYPNAVVDVFIELPQTDAGSRCAGICAASIALADAGIRMRDMIAAVSVGKVDDKLVVDLDYAEEAYEGGDVADIPVAMVPSTGEITLLQGDGLIKKEDLKNALELVKKPLQKIAEIQRKALIESYNLELKGDKK